MIQIKDGVDGPGTEEFEHTFIHDGRKVIFTTFGDSTVPAVVKGDKLLGNELLLNICQQLHIDDVVKMK